MSRPQLIRADTIDLQDQTSPSAKDHSRQPTHPSALGAGPPAPHQAETLREVAAETEHEEHQSPRMSNDWTNGEHQFESANGSKLQQQDASAIAQNGGLTGAEDADMADAEGDDGMDDDMMDKISSSPSIDDGGYSLPTQPAPIESVSQDAPIYSAAEMVMSSSPFVEKPEYYPLNFIDTIPQSERAMERAVQSDSSSYSHPFPTGEMTFATESAVLSQSPPISCTISPNQVPSSDTSTPSGKASTTYTNESRDVLAPLPGDAIENYDDDFEYSILNESFGDDSESDFEPFHEFSAYDANQLMIPYESSEEDYDGGYSEENFVAVGWRAGCLQATLEDIDFEFVYALHTFVATVEGQANATKGDTMVLLDDSNSYWWLVRVVKDSSIGYLPAEHIETPTERLARLNKHRNIDLSATMLGDQESKSKNPLKKAIRRRNAKTVTFSPPTYVEASDVDYSTDEEGEPDYYAQDQHHAAQQAELEEDEKTLVEPTAERAEVRDVESSTSELTARKNGDGGKPNSDVTRTSDEVFDGEKTNGKSRNGTVRNTDSFFKDDTVETRKITLTPNLLRDDSSTSTTRTSNDSKEIRQRPSMDRFEKDSVDKSKDDKKKKDKKEKDKKPGLLSNLFTRKKKKSQDEEDIDELIYGKKASGENARSSPAPSNDSGEFVVEEQTQGRQSSPQRQPSKLQKQPRIDTMIATTKPSSLGAEVNTESQQAPPSERPPPASFATEPSMRMVRSESQERSEVVQKSRLESPERTRDSSAQGNHDDTKVAGSFSKILRSRSHSNSEPKPEKVKKAKVRSELDDFDSSTESSPIEEPTKEEIKQPIREAPMRPSIPGAYPDSYITTPATDITNPMHERLSESPVQVSPVEALRSNPPALMVDTSSQEDAHSPVSSPSPELIDAEEIRGKKSSVNSMSTPTSTSTWSDTHLRTFFDDDSEIKDLLVVVYDKSGVMPAGPDHPITGNLFREENAKLADITNRLDGMLGDWLARKSKVSAR